MLDEVVTAYGAGVLSLDTAVQMLLDAGYPIDDASQEVARIRARAEEDAAARIAEAAAARDGRRSQGQDDLVGSPSQGNRNILTDG
ncbi:hypothetical protein ACM01_12105 [Streptomyces viridochromogenes]|uniref:Uncharacterized protein n=1 Tax=Streptomyces viridochromogenes TaxID=1938 RepID=A0A0J8CB24_STRVR|nr:hypothetical protein [Streptomyces viridochromogenes]KMS75015.1 hypothetical protein ACM01_12105 [Streptomyces viridochromogenes]